jgi:hypothetical protein
VSQTWRRRIFAAATDGTARRIPQSPRRVPPTSKAMITVTGCSLTVRATMFGLRM